MNLTFEIPLIDLLPIGGTIFWWGI